ncbi:hypothetical protein C8R43DRAFT_953789, partial [Mycena crocata]
MQLEATHSELMIASLRRPDQRGIPEIDPSPIHHRLGFSSENCGFVSSAESIPWPLGGVERRSNDPFRLQHNSLLLFLSRFTWFFNSSAPFELSTWILASASSGECTQALKCQLPSLSFPTSRSLAMPLRKSKGKAKVVEDPPDLFRNIRHPDVIDFLESMRTPRSFSATLRSKDPNGVSDLLLKFQRTLPYI